MNLKNGIKKIQKKSQKLWYQKRFSSKRGFIKKKNDFKMFVPSILCR